MEELEYLDLKKKITKIIDKKADLHTQQAARLRQEMTQLEVLYPDLIRLSELLGMTGNTVIPEDIKIKGIKCFFHDSFYSFSLKTDDTWEYAAGIIVDVDLKREDGPACQFKVSDPPFGYAESREITLTMLIHRFVDTYPAYEKEMIKRIENWLKDQRKMLRDEKI